jgi:hypothetical protein
VADHKESEFMARQKKRTAQKEAPPKPDYKKYIILVLLIFASIMTVVNFNTSLSVSGDNAEFIILGRSLAAGHGMTLMSDPESPVMTKFPFGFPLLIALVHTVVPNSLFALKLMVAGLFVVAIFGIYRAFASVFDPYLSALVSGATCLSVHATMYSSQVMSEMPYLLFSAVGIYSVQKSVAEPTNRNLGITVLCLISAYYIRSITVTLIAATIVVFLLHRLWRAAATIAIGTSLLALPWIIRNSLIGGPTYASAWLWRNNPYRPELGKIDMVGFVNRVIYNVSKYVGSEMPRLFVPTWYDSEFLTSPGVAPLGAVVGAILVVLTVASLIRWIRNKHVIGVYLLFYLGICLIWPQAWTDIRLLLPILPLILLGVAQSFESMIRAARAKNIAVVPIVLIVICCAISIKSNVGAMYARATRVGYDLNWDAFFNAAEWVKNHTEPDAIITCRKPLLLSVISGRKTINYPFTNDTAVILASMDRPGADYVIVSRISTTETRFLLPAIKAYPERFELVADQRAGFGIYRVKPKR